MENEINEYFKLNESDNSFFPIDGVSNRYSMNDKGLIWDSKFRKPIYPFLKHGKLVCNLFIEFENSISRRVTIIHDKLFLMCFSSMHTTLEVYIDKLKVIKLDNSKQYPSKDNLVWLIPNEGVECKDIPGFYSIPGNPDIVVDKEYNFLKYNTRKKCNIWINKSKRYPALYNDIEGKPFATKAIHRLVALAFIPLDGSDRLIVNHKDGNKFNYNVDNLEWVTYREKRICTSC